MQWKKEDDWEAEVLCEFECEGWSERWAREHCRERCGICEWLVKQSTCPHDGEGRTFWGEGRSEEENAAAERLFYPGQLVEMRNLHFRKEWTLGTLSTGMRVQNSRFAQVRSLPPLKEQEVRRELKIIGTGGDEHTVAVHSQLMVIEMQPALCAALGFEVLQDEPVQLLNGEDPVAGTVKADELQGLTLTAVKKIRPPWCSGKRYTHEESMQLGNPHDPQYINRKTEYTFGAAGSFTCSESSTSNGPEGSSSNSKCVTGSWTYDKRERAVAMQGEGDDSSWSKTLKEGDVRKYKVQDLE